MTFPERTRDTGATEHKRPLIGPIVAGDLPTSTRPAEAGPPIPPLFVRRETTEIPRAPEPTVSSTEAAPAADSERYDSDGLISHWLDDSFDDIAIVPELQSPSGQQERDGPGEPAAHESDAAGLEASDEPSWATSAGDGLDWAVPDWRPREADEESSSEMWTQDDSADREPEAEDASDMPGDGGGGVFGSDTVDSPAGMADDAEPLETGSAAEGWPESPVQYEQRSPDFGGAHSERSVEPPFGDSHTHDSEIEAALGAFDAGATGGEEHKGAEGDSWVWNDEALSAVNDASEQDSPAEQQNQSPSTLEPEPSTFAGEYATHSASFAPEEEVGGGVAEELPGETPAEEAPDLGPERVETAAPETLPEEVAPANPDLVETGAGWGDEWFTAAAAEADAAIDSLSLSEPHAGPPAGPGSGAPELRTGEGELDRRAIDLAERLERIARSLRSHGASGPLVTSGGDPLASLVAGYLLGMSDARESGRGESGSE